MRVGVCHPAGVKGPHVTKRHHSSQVLRPKRLLGALLLAPTLISMSPPIRVVSSTLFHPILSTRSTATFCPFLLPFPVNPP